MTQKDFQKQGYIANQWQYQQHAQVQRADIFTLRDKLQRQYRCRAVNCFPSSMA